MAFISLFIFRIGFAQFDTQNPIPESLPAQVQPAESINQTRIQTADSLPQNEIKEAKKTGKAKFYKSPGKAMLLSTLLPGAGQFYTQNYLKGTVMLGAWSILGSLSIREHVLARDALRKNNNQNYLEHRDKRNNLLWWTAAVWVFSIADAYVSSHMYKFKEQESLGFNFKTQFLAQANLMPKIDFSLELRLRKF